MGSFIFDEITYTVGLYLFWLWSLFCFFLCHIRVLVYSFANVHENRQLLVYLFAFFLPLHRKNIVYGTYKSSYIR